MDPLSEFLGYYRVMESVERGGNGTTLVDDLLGRFRAFRPGVIKVLAPTNTPRRAGRKPGLIRVSGIAPSTAAG